MEEPTNQDQSELFKNIAIATVVSINDVKVMPADGVMTIGEIAPTIIPEPVHNIEEAIAIAVVKSSQDGDGNGSEGASEPTLSPSQTEMGLGRETGTRTGNPQNHAIGNKSKSIKEKTIDIGQLLGNNKSDDVTRQIAGDLVRILNEQGIAITDNNGVKHTIDIPDNISNQSEEITKLMDQTKDILENIFADV